MMLNTPENDQLLNQKELFLNRAWTDSAFRTRLENDPNSVFAEMGVNISENVELKIVFDTDNVKYLHIPSAPVEGEVSDDDLLNAQGGTTTLFCVVATSALTVVAVSIATAVKTISDNT